MLRWRRLGPGEIDHEAIWLAVSGCTVAGAAAWLSLGLHLPPCAFREITGQCCVSCGATTCFLALLRGDFSAALAANPGVFFGLVGLAVYDAYAATVLAARLPRLRCQHGSAATSRGLRYAALVLLGLNWLYVMRR